MENCVEVKSTLVARIHLSADKNGLSDEPELTYLIGKNK